VKRTGLTPEQKTKLALFDNRTAELADWDVDVLGALDLDLGDLWFDNELAEMGIGLDDAPEDPGPQIDKAAELQEKWQTARGQVWEIGKHRLMCGDSTSAEDVGRLMGGEKAQAVVTDPPYGVRDDKWDNFTGVDAFLAFTACWLRCSKSYADVVASFMADKNVPLLLVAAERVGLLYRRALIWRKPPGSQFAGASLDGYWYDFEIIQIFGRPQFVPDKKTRMAVLEHRTITGQEHGCEKPPALLVDILTGYVEVGEGVIDPFLGSGTTMVAAEQTGRICYGMEIEPKYCAVTLERMAGMGLEPIQL